MLTLRYPKIYFQRISRWLFEASEETIWYAVYLMCTVTTLYFFLLIMSARFTRLLYFMIFHIHLIQYNYSCVLCQMCSGLMVSMLDFRTITLNLLLGITHQWTTCTYVCMKHPIHDGVEIQYSAPIPFSLRAIETRMRSGDFRTTWPDTDFTLYTVVEYCNLMIL